MAKLTDLAIRQLILKGERFSGLADSRCPGLYLSWPEKYSAPFWRYRWKTEGRQKTIALGKYPLVGLSAARSRANDLRAMVRLGRDPALEKKERKAANKAKELALAGQRSLAELTEEFIQRHVDEKLKRPLLIRQRLTNHIKASPFGNHPIDQIKPLHIDALIQAVVMQGKNRLANDLLRYLKRIFDYAVKRHLLEHNPAVAFNASDAGGRERSRERTLSLDEIARLLGAMEESAHFADENRLAVRLLLLLGVRKMELLAAQWPEFVLDDGVWNLPASRSKTGASIRIPLPPAAVELLRSLEALACGSLQVFPRRGGRKCGHVAESTLNQALYNLKPGIGAFTVHDLRRTVRTQLGALRIPPHICERCLNHKIGGVEGVYDRYDYFEERREALDAWANVLAGLESGGKVVPIGTGREARA